MSTATMNFSQRGLFVSDPCLILDLNPYIHQLDERLEKIINDYSKPERWVVIAEIELAIHVVTDAMTYRQYDELILDEFINVDVDKNELLSVFRQLVDDISQLFDKCTGGVLYYKTWKLLENGHLLFIVDQ